MSGPRETQEIITMTTLYRAFDAAGRLLYVGIARNWARRWTQHSERSSWFGEVARLQLEQHPNRQAALAAERTAIIEELPAYNVVHNGHARRLDQVQEVVMAVRLFDGRCPVGLIRSDSGTSFSLELYQWLIGRFLGDTIDLHWSEVHSTLRAERLPSGVFDMEPLAVFQTEWVELVRDGCS